MASEMLELQVEIELNEQVNISFFKSHCVVNIK